MEIIMLVLLYYLSQNPDFADSVQPLMAKLKNSQQMLNFLNDLSKFTQTFSSLKTEEKTKEKPSNEQASKQEDASKGYEKPQSPTSGIADAFIENILNNYLKK